MPSAATAAAKCDCVAVCVRLLKQYQHTSAAAAAAAAGCEGTPAASCDAASPAAGNLTEACRVGHQRETTWQLAVGLLAMAAGPLFAHETDVWRAAVPLLARQLRSANLVARSRAADALMRILTRQGKIQVSGLFLTK